MIKKSQKITRAAFEGAQLAWSDTESVIVKDLSGKPIEIRVRAGMPLTDIFEMVVETAVAQTSEGHYTALFGDMIMAQAIIDIMTDLPLLDDPEQMDIDQCYELVFGYDGIDNSLDPAGPASHLIQKIRAYTADFAERLMMNPDAFDMEEDDFGDIMDLDDLRKMRKN